MAADDALSALRLSIVSVAWTAIASAVGVVLGIADSSLVLVALGATGLVDAAGSALLASHFHELSNSGHVSVSRERRAHLVICCGLMTVGAAAVCGGAYRVLSHEGGGGSAAAVALAAASTVVLAALSTLKLRLASRMESEPLRADGFLSATGGVLALVTLVGVVLSNVRWVDGTFTLFIGGIASAVGARSARQID